MAIEYYFNNLDPTGFQRLINAVLVSRFGEAIRLLPLRGTDGGRDAETPPGAPVFEIDSPGPASIPGLPFHLPKGRYVFQVKHHRTIDAPVSTVRTSVVADFEGELRKNVLTRSGEDKVDFFFLVTNVPASKDSVAKLDEKRRELIKGASVKHADVLWGEHVTAWLDQSPHIWSAFPDLFAGRVPPRLGEIADDGTSGLPRAVRAALAVQFSREGSIRFRQIELEEKLTRLFVDLSALPSTGALRLVQGIRHLRFDPGVEAIYLSADQTLFLDEPPIVYSPVRVGGPNSPSCTRLLTAEDDGLEQPILPRRIILEGGPGQGKSTMTQMVAQIYRAMLLDRSREYAHLGIPKKARLPIRIELRIFAEWMDENHGTIEEFIARILSKDSGGAAVSVDDFQKLCQDAPLLLIFDGLDEIGSDDSRDAVLTQISECLERLETGLKANVKAILTTRPPAIAGRSDRIKDFVSLQIASLDDARMDEYISRWTTVRCSDEDDRQRVTQSFNKRRQEPHVKALAQNPMQLSVLLHFIRSQGEAFPDRRAELFRDYFKTVIDRDVEKTPRLRTWRGDIEALHQLIAFKIHSWAETERSSGSITRPRLISVVEEWLQAEDRDTGAAKELFRLGEERLGLIVALTGEGGETKYGFEIQPVREYFAAAYINERVSGNAHDLFEAMARRSFWREVALLLAGLRRANEKADLLSRAQNLDEAHDLGWRQDGRKIVLDLLREGVLTSPGGVQRDSILFLLQVLDPSDRLPRNEAKELLPALPGILNACSASVPSQVIKRFLATSRTITDAGALYRLYKIAHRFLGAPAIEEHLRELTAEGSRVSAARHILWPDASRISMLDISRSRLFWPKGESRQWAAAWYEAAFEDSAKTALAAEDSYHPLLLECFAFNSIRNPAPLPGAFRPFESSPSSWAVWRLRDSLLSLPNVLSGKPKQNHGDRLDHKIDYSGLGGALEATVRPLIESSAEIAKHVDAHSRLKKSLDQFFIAVVDGLEAEGISGWVACRCAISVLESTEIGGGRYRFYVESDGAAHWVSRRSSLVGFERLASWGRLKRIIATYYRAASKRKRSQGIEARPIVSARELVSSGFAAVPPDQVRCESALRPIFPLLLAHIGDTAPEIPWISGLPIPRVWFRDLFSVGQKQLPSVLAHLSAHGSFNGPPAPLPAPTMQKILGIVRRTNDAAVSSGALVALLDSNFWSLVDNKTLLKMIQVDSEHADVASRLFDIGPGADRERSRRLEISQSIVGGEVLVSRATAVAAAQYLASNAPLAFPPLISLPLVKAG